MHLLDSEQLELAFQLHRIDHDVLARRLYQDVWEQIKLAERHVEPLAVGACRQEIRKRCRIYFAAMRGWTEDNAAECDPSLICRQSQINGREAAELLDGFEKHFIRYALCYLDLNRVMVRARKRIVRLSGGGNLDKIEAPAIDHATGILLIRLHRERSDIMQKRQRLERAREILRGIDPLLERLGSDLPRRLGQNQGDRQLTLFKGALRQRNFGEAHKIIAVWADPSLARTALAVLSAIQSHEAVLEAQGSLILHSGETGLIGSFLMADEARLTARIDRLNVPYMVFQYRVLIQTAGGLGRIGTLEGLIILHAKILGLIARPHGDPAQAQRDMQSILIPARVAIGRFKTLSGIFAAMETCEAILEKLFVHSESYRTAD